MEFFDKLKNLFSPKKTDVTSSSAPTAVMSSNDVEAMVLSNPNLQEIFDNESVKKIPRDQNVTPLSILAGLILNGSNDGIVGYNLVHVNDDGSVDVNLKGATVDVGSLVVHISAVPEFPGDQVDSVIIYGATSGDVTEKILTASRRVVVDGSQVTQPVSGTIAATQSGTWNINNVTGTVSLPTGAATEATLSTINGKLVNGNDIGDVTINNASGASAVNIQDGGNSITVDGTVTANIGATNGLLLDTTFTGRINTQGQKTMATSTPVVIASDQSAIAVSQSGTWNITNVTGTVSLPTGASTSAKQDTGNTSLASIDGKLNSLGQKTMANSVPVVLALDQNAITTSEQKSATATRSDVSRSNASQTILALNSSRKGATIYNDAAANLFLKFGTTATTSDFTTRLQSNDYFEVPFGYTGRIDGIWASAGAGAARITELT